MDLCVEGELLETAVNGTPCAFWICDGADVAVVAVVPVVGVEVGLSGTKRIVDTSTEAVTWKIYGQLAYNYLNCLSN